jgi:hypothetical protein
MQLHRAKVKKATGSSGRFFLPLLAMLLLLGGQWALS